MTPLFEVKLDESNVLKALDSLEAKVTGPVVMEALKAAAEVIRDNARRKLVQMYPAAAYAPTKGPFRNNGALVDRIFYAPHDKDKSVNVNILSDPRLIWLEAGTVERTTRHKSGRLPANRGRVPSGHFFGEAYGESSGDVEVVMMSVFQKFYDSLEK